MKKSKKGIVHLLSLILVGVIIAAVGGYFYFSQNSNTRLTTETSPTSEITYQSYVNNNLGFEVEYPNIDDEITPYEPVDKNSVSFCREGTDACTLFVKKYINENFEEIYYLAIDRKDVIVNSTDLEEVSLNGKLFHKAYIEYVDSKNTYYYLQNEADVFVIIIPWSISNHAKILSTFEITNKQEVETDDWQTYTNQTYNYTIKYPSNWKLNDDSVDYVEIYNPSNDPSDFFPGLKIEYSGKLSSTDGYINIKHGIDANTETVYKFNAMDGAYYYFNIPGTDNFIGIAGAKGYTPYEETNKIIRKMFSTFEFID